MCCTPPSKWLRSTRTPPRILIILSFLLKKVIIKFTSALDQSEPALHVVAELTQPLSTQSCQTHLTDECSIHRNSDCDWQKGCPVDWWSILSTSWGTAGPGSLDAHERWYNLLPCCQLALTLLSLDFWGFLLLGEEGRGIRGGAQSANSL